MYCRRLAVAMTISIHAPRGGSDPHGKRCGGNFLNFNPRSPRGERLDRKQMCPFLSIFQSTLPAGGATDVHADFIKSFTISIHAPRGGSDISSRRAFLST